MSSPSRLSKRLEPSGHYQVTYDLRNCISSH